MKETFYLNISTADDLGIGLFKYSLKPDEKFIIINSTFAHILGYASKKELQDKLFSDYFAHSENSQAFFMALKEEGKVKFFEAIFKKGSGRDIWVAITASIIKSRSREYIEGIIEDISEHKHMEERLALERDFLQGLLDNIPDAIYFKDKQNRIIKVNKFYVDGFKVKYEDIIGKTDFDFFPKEQAQKMSDDDNSVLATGNPIVGKVENTLLPNGSWNQVITTKIPMYDIQGKIIGTMGITRDITAYAHLEKQRMAMLLNALTALSKVLEMRDPYTYTHNRNVAFISETIAKTLGWDENRLLGMRLAGQLHDLGKISIPLDILNKPGKLSDIEFLLIQEHVIRCYDIVKDIDFPFSLAETIYQHHERLDGTGYPRKLSQDDIILEARILAVSDVLESMASYRPYREALGIKRAMEELENGQGLRYDSEIVSVVSDIVKANEGKIFWMN